MSVHFMSSNSLTTFGCRTGISDRYAGKQTSEPRRDIASALGHCKQQYIHIYNIYIYIYISYRHWWVDKKSDYI